MGTGILGTCSSVGTRFTAGCSAVGTGFTAVCSAGITGKLKDALLWARVSREPAMPQVLDLLAAAVPGTQGSKESAVRWALTSMEAAEQRALGS